MSLPLASRRRSRPWAAVLSACCALAAAGCGSKSDTAADPPQTLSEYGLFVGDGSTQEPVAGVIGYDLNSALFSDYTVKRRFVKLPPGTQVKYHPHDSFEFPVGTIIAKTFSLPRDLGDPSRGERLLETRILWHTEQGWIGLPYIWNADETEATLELAGGTVDVRWVHTDGRRRTNNYIVPNANQCKGCHKTDGVMKLIGPKARHLNRDLVYAHGTENQLAYWTRSGALAGAPPPERAPRLAAWDDERTGTLDERARAWLEINCAHCHQPGAPAQNSGLDLLAGQTHPAKYGVYKPPVAAGRGSGGLLYDIVPGQPDQSILLFRIASTHPDVMMPELGKRLVHEEGVRLIRQWIAHMPQPREKATQALRAARRGKLQAAVGG